MRRKNPQRLVSSGVGTSLLPKLSPDRKRMYKQTLRWLDAQEKMLKQAAVAGEKLIASGKKDPNSSGNASYFIRHRLASAETAISEARKQAHNLLTWPSLEQAVDLVHDRLNSVQAAMRQAKGGAYAKGMGGFAVQHPEPGHGHRVFSKKQMRHDFGWDYTRMQDPARFIDQFRSIWETTGYSFPTAVRKHPGRIKKLIGRTLLHREPASGRLIRPTFDDLKQAGIPTADIAGPWAEDPKAWVNENHALKFEEDHDREATVSDWMRSIGMDSVDHALRSRIEQEGQRHGRRPSRERARQISNQLTEERQKEEIGAKVPHIEKWLEWSVTNERPRTLPSGWRYFEPGDGPEIVKRAKRDGLCVADVIARLGKLVESGDEPHPMSDPEIWHLVTSTDPTRRTIVGLDEEGMVDDEHHCTGNKNQVDQEAYEYFSQPAGVPVR